MRKLVRGIVEFRKKLLPSYRKTFAQLALGQRPDALMIACSDSRVAPNVFASSEPGDLFVIRNVGNLIPPSGNEGLAGQDVSEAAAIEFSLTNLPVKDIIVCGHSECGAMCAVMDRAPLTQTPHLKNWLMYGEPSYQKLANDGPLNPLIAPHNQLSQANVLQQIEHLKTYPIVKKRMEEGTLKIHGWWFDIAHADVYAYDQEVGHFVLIDTKYAERFLERMDAVDIGEDSVSPKRKSASGPVQSLNF